MTPRSGGQLGNGIFVGDFDGDWRVDLFVAHQFGASRIYRNNGDGTFTDITRQTRASSTVIETIKIEGGKVEITGQSIKVEGGKVEIIRRQP